jgi:DNA polymerase-3 subunit delta'
MRWHTDHRIMSEAESPEPPHPRETTAWFGHAEAERTLLDAFRSGRIPHAWLIGGPAGIGKATLAYRMARFVLANPDPTTPAVARAHSLAVDPQHPVVRRVAAQSHTDLLVLERTVGPSGTLRTVITVDEVRRTVSFFGSTAGEGGWRVCIVDTADELQAPHAANALLKVLEEPPPRALFLLASHAPGRLLPTIRSRCRRLVLRALGEEDVARAAAEALARTADEPEIREAARAAQGSVGQAITLLGGRTLAVRKQVIELLGQLPALDRERMHALGDALGRADEAALDACLDAMRDWLHGRLAIEEANPARLARVAEVWEKLNRAAGEVEEFNLERKPLVFAAFGLLAEAARG